MPAERLVEEQDLLGVLPSLGPRLDRAVFRTVDKLSCVRSARPATRCRPGWSTERETTLLIRFAGSIRGPTLRGQQLATV